MVKIEKKLQKLNLTNCNLLIAQDLWLNLADNILGADLSGMQWTSKFNKGIHFLLCVNGLFGKFAWVILLKDKRGITITSTFQKNITWRQSQTKQNVGR